MALVSFEVLLTVIYIVGEMVKYSTGWEYKGITFFNLDIEGTIPSWFSSIQWFCVGLLALVIASKRRPRELPARWFFVIAGLAAVFFSFDEASTFHERLSDLLVKLDFFPRFADDNGAWIFPYIAAIVIALIVLRPQLFALLQQHRREGLLLLAAGAIFVTGAAGFEIFGYEAFWANRITPGYYLEVAGEEFLEMAGVSLALYALLRILLSLERPARA
jgi:hypothetical protein